MEPYEFVTSIPKHPKTASTAESTYIRELIDTDNTSID